jgi:hypothetical protein
VGSRCPLPGHDRVASLSYGPGDHGGIVMKCHAHCETSVVLATKGLTVVDLMGKPYKVEEYHYTTEDGTLLWTVERWANPKTFKQRRPGPDGTWIWSAPALADRVLYNLGGIAYAREHGEIVYRGGGRRMSTLHDHGLIGTTGSCRLARRSGYRSTPRPWPGWTWWSLLITTTPGGPTRGR